MVAGLAKAVSAALAEQDFMEATKLKLTSAMIAHDQEQAEQTSRALRGLSQVGAAEFLQYFN